MEDMQNKKYTEPATEMADSQVIQTMKKHKTTVALTVTAAAGLALLSFSASRAIAQAAPAASPAAVRLSAAPLGADVGMWDSAMSAAGTRSAVHAYSSAQTLNAAEPFLKAAGIDQLHYTGGTLSDQYNWETDTITTPTGSYHAALTFAKFSADARAVGAQSSVNVNYGTGTAALAAAWARQARTTAGQHVSDWMIGNENYGCWEPNNPLGGPPENYKGYVPNDGPSCPMGRYGLNAGMQTMARSYAYNAGKIMAAIKAADPTAQLGVPWAFDGTVGGASVGDNADWNNIVLGADHADIGFVDAHWYPTGSASPNNQQVLTSLTTIPSEYGKIRAELNAYDPSAKVIVGETGVSNHSTLTTCTPVGAVFAAGNALSWLAAGAQAVNWWPLDTTANLGSRCVNPDEGMFTNNGTPNTPYYGYYLVSALARPGALLSTLATSSPGVLGFQSVLPNGKVTVALVNTSTSAPARVTARTALAGNLATASYSAGNQNASNSKIVRGRTTATAIASGITVPAESITILADSPVRASLRLAPSATTVRPGTRVTVTATLGAPHAEILNIYAKPQGSARKEIGRGTVNSRGQLSVTYSVKLKTTFTVIFYGDAWYLPASAAVTVKA